jgi:hypothetical protein
MATRVSSSGAWMSATRPHVKRETRRSSILLELLRVLVARDDDLLARLMERVEGVEELFLRLRLAREKLDVVDEEQVAPLAVARAKLVHLLILSA